MGTTTITGPGSGHALTLVRVFDAPPALVFRMWTDPVHMRAWSYPRGFTIPEASGGPAAVGGSFRVTMRGPDGEHVLTGTYLEVTPPRRIVFTHAWERSDGTTSPPTTVDVRLVDLGGRTELTLHQAFFDTEGARDGHKVGWSESLDKLREHLRP